jgi:hypothetical protein
MSANKKNKWEGLRAVVIARQSNDKDGDASTEAQNNYMAIKVNDAGMRHVDTCFLEGVSGSAPARINEILQKLFDRKKKHDDFDVIAWQIEDRASRSGGEHGLWLQHEAKRHGLLVFFPEDAQSTTPAAFRAFKYDAAMDAAMSTGRRSAQGQDHAQKKGFFRTAGPTPFGCDRIYYGEDHRPKFILHNLAGGLQEQREFGTGKVIGRFGTAGRKSHNRFKKQKNEYSLLYPGDRDQRKAVRVIFYMRYKKGWRGLRIADFLNRNSIPSPQQKQWSQRQVQIIYENTAYTGVTFNNKTFSGRYYRRDRILGFLPLERDECELVMKKTFVPKLRPVDDWDRIDQPHMYDFLPRDVRDLAIEAQAQLLEQRADPARRKRKPNAHPASLFFLSDRLRAAQGGRLVGTMSGPPGHKIPYYRHRRSKRGHRRGSVFNNLIPAKALHDAVINLLADVLEDMPGLREQLRQHVIAHRAAAERDNPDLAQLEAERDDLQHQITIILHSLKGAALVAQQPELERLGNRVNALATRIHAASTKDATDLRPVEKVVDDAMHVLQLKREALRTLPAQPLRDLVDRLVVDAVVDMATKTVELTIALPTWALQAPRKILKNGLFTPSEDGRPLCPDDSTWSPAGSWTQTVLTVAQCTYAWTRGSHTVPPCYRCRRSAA